MSVVRALLAAFGTLVLGWGVVLLLGLGPRQVLAVAGWLVGGLLLHDGVLAPVVVGLGALAAARLPGRVRVPLVGLLVVLGPLTLATVPVLGRFGARADNPTLLDRPYWSGYLAVVVLAVLVALAWVARRAGTPRAEDGRPTGPASGGP